MDELDIFNKLKIGIASDEKIREWSKGEVKKPEMVYFVKKYLDQQKTGNVIVVNIKEYVIKELSVTVVV